MRATPLTTQQLLAPAEEALKNECLTGPITEYTCAWRTPAAWLRDTTNEMQGSKESSS